jgi:hypothetical protein
MTGKHVRGWRKGGAEDKAAIPLEPRDDVADRAGLGQTLHVLERHE